MRAPEIRFRSLWLSLLLFTMVTSPVWAQVSGQITGVRLDSEKKQLVIESKGELGEHVARVMARPNRLILDFKNTGLDRVPNKIKVRDDAIKEIRMGSAESRARLVLDFQDRPVPAFQVQRAKGMVTVAFGAGMPTGDPSVGAQAEPAREKAAPALASKPVPAPADKTAPAVPAVKGSAQPAPGLQARNQVAEQPKAKSGWRLGSWTESATNPPKAPQVSGEPRRIKFAQNMDLNLPPAPRNRGDRPAPPGDAAPMRKGGDEPAGPIPSHQGAPAPGQMVREVRPPVTPPTPDPRLLVQEITELKFIQVGHNARLIIRGGDHLDYRLNNVSPTKVKIDLINAEIPKLHQKPLRTDLFSTSVEMIVPGSQTVFVQLKDTVPLQIEKQKGVLMVDFPPPRFVLTPDQKAGGGIGRPGQGDQVAREAYRQSREERRQALEAIKEQEILKSNELRRKGIESLQKQQEELEKQRTEVLKRYRVTPDPQVFQKPVSMDFQGISLKNAFRLLAEQAGINIILDDKVTGATTLRLFQVPLGQVIDTILNSHDLDREMVGNVMRIGKKKDIEDLKKARLEEYQKRMDEVTKRLGEIAEEIKNKTEESQTALKALEKTAVEVEEPKEDLKTEEIGEAGCVKIGNKDVCFYYAQIKLIYATPKPVVETLRCMFNLQCVGLPDAGGAVNAESAVKREARAESQVQEARANKQQELNDLGFAPGSPGYERAMRRFDTDQAVEQSARAQTVTSVGVAQAAQGAQGQKGGPVLEEELRQIILHSMIWPDETNRIVFIKDTADRIAQMKKVIYGLDKPDPQVMIEGRLVEASQNWSRGLGIIWGGRNNQVGSVKNNRSAYWGYTGLQGGGDANTATGESTAGDNIPSSFAVNLPASVVGGAIQGLGMQFGLLATEYITELDYRLSMGEHNGQAKTIARPKVTVLNKQKANIKRGTTIPYQTVGASGTQTQFVSADLGLDVTPEIFPDGRIRLTIKFTNNEPDYANNTDAGPPIRTKEANTVMTVKDGQTAVIGGILQEAKGFSRDGWPGLMNVPVINFLFSNKSTNTDLNEILVFITPTIVKRPPPAS